MPPLLRAADLGGHPVEFGHLGFHLVGPLVEGTHQVDARQRALLRPDGVRGAGHVDDGCVHVRHHGAQRWLGLQDGLLVCARGADAMIEAGPVGVLEAGHVVIGAHVRFAEVSLHLADEAMGRVALVRLARRADGEVAEGGDEQDPHPQRLRFADGCHLPRRDPVPGHGMNQGREAAAGAQRGERGRRAMQRSCLLQLPGHPDTWGKQAQNPPSPGPSPVPPPCRKADMFHPVRRRNTYALRWNSPLRA